MEINNGTRISLCEGSSESVLSHWFFPVYNSIIQALICLEKHPVWSRASLQGLRRTVGSGERINVWLEKWIFDTEPKAPMRKPILFNVDLRFCDLINPQTRTWDRGTLEENFPPIQLILKQKLATYDVDSQNGFITSGKRILLGHAIDLRVIQTTRRFREKLWLD